MTDSTFNEALLNAITIEDNELVITSDVVANHLKTVYDTDIEDVEKMQDAVNNTANDLVGAAGKLGVDHMADNKELANISGAFKIGNQTTTLNVKREHAVRVSVSDPSKGTRTVHGYVDAHTSSGVVATVRRNVRNEVSAYAEIKLK